MSRMWRSAASVAAAMLVLLALPAAALAHATLIGSKPGDGRTLKRSPGEFLLKFDEGIDMELVRLRVEDSAGRSVAVADPYHPGGREELIAVRVARRLDDGTYVARFRVISEDGHPVGRRTVFRVRSPEPAVDRRRQPAGPEAAGATTPPMDGGGEEHVDELTGGVTDAAFGVARGAGYLAMALAIGASVFLLVVWLPSLAQQAGPQAGWRASSERFVKQVRRVVLGAVLLGLAASAAAIVLEAATAVGVSFWGALDAERLDLVADTRVVRAWGARFIVWIVLGVLVAVALRPGRSPVLRRAALGADGVALAPAPSRAQQVLLLAVVLALVLTVPMAGHAGTHTPRGLLICVDAAHVLCMSIWIGGLAMLLVALAVAARSVPGRDRAPLMAVVVGRFSRLATIVVAVLVGTGIVQSVVLVGSVGALFETAYGRLVLAKVALLLGLLCVGAYNQRRTLPRLRRLAAAGDGPGATDAILGRAVAAELALAIVVIGVTSVLVVTAPPGPS